MHPDEDIEDQELYDLSVQARDLAVAIREALGERCNAEHVAMLCAEDHAISVASLMRIASSARLAHLETRERLAEELA